MKGPVPDSWCDSVNPLMFCVGLCRWPGAGRGGYDPMGTSRLIGAVGGFVPVLCQMTGIFTFVLQGIVY